MLDMKISVKLSNGTSKPQTRRVKHPEVLHPGLGVMVDRDAVGVIDAVMSAGFETAFSCGGDPFGKAGYVAFEVDALLAHQLTDLLAASELATLDRIVVQVTQKGDAGVTSVIVRWGWEDREFVANTMREVLNSDAAVAAVAGAVVTPAA